MPNDLEQVIEDSINDSLAPAEDTTAPEETTTSVDAAVEETTEASAGTEVEATPESNQIASPAQKEAEATTTAQEEDFAKRFGLQSQSVTGRENRIPYSRVKKIVEKNEKDTIARVTKELESKYAKFPEFETKLKDYEGRLERVAQFENILETEPKTFLGMLSQHPAYKEFFEFVEQAVAAQEKQPAATAAPATTAPEGMPQPDATYADGTKGYSQEGLQKLLDWKEQQAVQKAIAQVEARYKPIEQAWQSQEQMAKMVPIVEKQIAEARQWDKFSELEPKVVEILKNDRNISLERAYVKAYQEATLAERSKLTTDRNTIRSEVLAELKKKPASSATTAGAVKPTPAATGPKSMEEIIRESLEQAGHQISS
jgi:hypothetical protein